MSAPRRLRSPSRPRRTKSTDAATATSEAGDPACRGPGRPRCEQACAAIRAAALDLLGERGFAALTIEGVAERAGVGKATIYRWWSGKAALVVDAFFARVSPHIAFVDTGSVRGDFTDQLRHVIREMSGPSGQQLGTLVSGAFGDDALADAFRTRWLGLRRAEASQVIERGVARGELPADIDHQLLCDLIYSPLYFRLLIRHQPLRLELAERIVDAVLDGVLLPRPARARRTRG